MFGFSRKPTHVRVFFVAILAAGYFLLLAQKKVTKEKGTLAVAVCRASMPGKLREDAQGSAGSTSVCRVGVARILPATARGYFLRACSPRPRGNPGRAERGSPCRRSTGYMRHRIYPTRRSSFLSFALPFGSPLSSGGGWTDQPREDAGGARDRADSDNRAGMPCGPNPSARSEPLAPRAARIRGCLFLWLLSFGQAKESNWRPWMADKTHTDVSRLSRQHRRPKPRTNTIPTQPSP